MLTHVEPTAYPEPTSFEEVGSDVAEKLDIPPIPPFATGKYPETEVARFIFGLSPIDPSWE